MPKLLFVVHGMERHEPAWAGNTVQALVELPDRYQYAWFADNGALDQHVEIIPVHYDNVFAKYVNAWGRSVEELRAKAAEYGVSIPNVLSWLQRADETEKNFFWTHVVDVLLYRFFSIVAAEVRLRLRLTIAEKLTEAKEGGQLDEASVLAHSLGTSVTHDSLALLGAQPIETDDGPNESWMAANHRFSNVFMCANVSRVLETEPKVYQSVLHPTTGGQGESYVEAYYNFRHRLDPFPMVKPFGPVGWGENYLAVENCEKVLDFNVHGLGHYLSDPRVHVPVLCGLIGQYAVTDDEYDAAVAEYDALEEPECVDALTAFRTNAQRLIALAQSGADAETLVIAGTQFLAAASEARDACDQT